MTDSFLYPWEKKAFTLHEHPVYMSTFIGLLIVRINGA